MINKIVYDKATGGILWSIKTDDVRMVTFNVPESAAVLDSDLDLSKIDKVDVTKNRVKEKVG